MGAHLHSCWAPSPSQLSPDLAHARGQPERLLACRWPFAAECGEGPQAPGRHHGPHTSPQPQPPLGPRQARRSKGLQRVLESEGFVSVMVVAIVVADFDSEGSEAVKVVDDAVGSSAHSLGHCLDRGRR